MPPRLLIASGLHTLQCVWDQNSVDETHCTECGGGGVLDGDAGDGLDFDPNRAAGNAGGGAAGGRDRGFGRGGVSGAAVAGAAGAAGSCAGTVSQAHGAAHHDGGRGGRGSGVHGGRRGARLSDQPGGGAGGDCGGAGGREYGGLHGAGGRDHAAHGFAVGDRGERRVPYLPGEEDAGGQGTDSVWVAAAGARAGQFAGAVELCEAGGRVYVVVVRRAGLRARSLERSKPKWLDLKTMVDYGWWVMGWCGPNGK